jgi:DNA-binding Lrp family transcriptional regulator
MSTSALILKNPRGWFAAGVEMQKTMTLLSDGAFKLFVYLCLNARRESGVLEATQADLARGLKKTPRTIRRSLGEMEKAGVLRYTHFTHNPQGRGLVRIAEAFWPYQTSEQQADRQDSGNAFVAEIRKKLEARACVQAAFSVADEILAHEWMERGITLERIDQAILLGCVRKYVSWRNNPTHGPIASLRYFESVLEEIEGQKIEPDYWNYLRSRLQRMEELWKQAHARTDPEGRKSAALAKTQGTA